MSDELILSEHNADECEQKPFTVAGFSDLLSDAVVAKLTGLMSSQGSLKISQRMTLHELMQYWLDQYAKLHCKQWFKYEGIFKNHLATLADKDINEITRKEIHALQVSLLETNGKSASNHAIELIRMLYNRAIDWNMFEGINPAARIRLSKIKARERFLQPHELAPWFAAVHSLRNETTKDLLFMLLFTGARRRNVSEMRWADISEQHSYWRIEETKNGDSQINPLIEPAMEILRRRRRCHPI